MKILVQRVKKAVVMRKIDDGFFETVGQIREGLLVLVGFKKNDSKKEVEILANKLFKLRIMNDDESKMNLTVKDVGGKYLVISQFTLYGDTKKGNRPSFVDAEDPKKAKVLYDHFVSTLKGIGANVETGSFGNYMKIEAVLDGPSTIIYE